MLTKPARTSDPADVPPPPKGGFGFIWRYGLGWGIVAILLFLAPLGGLSLYGLPIAVGLAGITVGYTSFRRQVEPFFMPSLRHGAGAGALAIIPMVIFLLIFVQPDFLVQGGVDEADATYGPVMIALSVCCAGMPLAVLMGALGGMAGAILAQLRTEPINDQQ